MKLIKGDEVLVTVGKDSGKTGKIGKVFTKLNKVMVEGVNQYKRHVKARTPQQTSEIVTITKPLPVSNVALMCPHCKKQTRVGYTIENKTKVRICRKCEKRI
ncbi:50S ribosomal protein L24 [soil metagenome]